MKCQKCGVNEATTHVKTITNGEYAEFDLCPSCAKKMGYTNFFADMENEFSNLLGSFFGNALPARSQATRCENCGSTYAEISKTGQVGCPECYAVFAEELFPSITRLHGNTTHCGKTPHRLEYVQTEETDMPVQEQKTSKIEDLQARLKQAVKEQNFEKAAELRDKIKELEEK